MDTINTNQIEIGGKLLNIEPKKLNGNVQINLTGDVSGSIDTPIEAGKTITIETRVEGGTGGGIPEAPIDDKQYARKNASWVEVEGGGGASAFKAIYGTTSYAEVLAAINADSIVICDVSGYIYQYVNKDSTKIVFALTEKNSSGNVMNETVWVNSDDTWDGEAIRVAKHSEVPTLTSQLTNDAGFSKVVVGNAPPAAGTPDDTITLILGGAGGAGEYGAWELIGEGTGLSMDDTISLSKNVSSFDFIVANAISNGGGNISHIYPVHSLIYGTSAFILNGSNNQLNLLVYDNYLYVAKAGIPNVKLYGISLRGKSNVYSTDEVAIGKWIDGKTIYRKVISVPSFFYAQRWVSIGSIDNAGFPTKAEYICNYHKVQGDASYFCGDIGCRFVGNDVQVFSERFTGKTSTQYTSYIIVEYTKNE